jgi:hypothetical protein
MINDRISDGSINALRQSLVETMATTMMKAASIAENLTNEPDTEMAFGATSHSCLQLAAVYRTAAADLEAMALLDLKETARPFHFLH